MQRAFRAVFHRTEDGVVGEEESGYKRSYLCAEILLAYIYVDESYSVDWK